MRRYRALRAGVCAGLAALSLGAMATSAQATRELGYPDGTRITAAPAGDDQATGTRITGADTREL